MQTEDLAEDLHHMDLEHLTAVDHMDDQDVNGASQIDHATEEDSDFTDEEVDREVRQDLQQFGIYRALPVYGEPDFDSGPPATAEEYLRRVRHEAARLPEIVTSAVDPRLFDGRQTAYVETSSCHIPEAPNFARPSHQWIVQFLQDFVGVRQDLQRAEAAQDFERVRVPSEGDHGTWRTFCFGGTSGEEARQPTLPVLMAIDQVKCGYLLKWHTDWAVASHSVSQQSATWLYAITARLERPLTQGNMSALRSLLRHCARLRAGLTDPGDPLLPNFNILIAIAGAFFGQDEKLAGIWDQEA